MSEPEHLRGLNPEQLDAVMCTEGPLLILAGAGSGKTRVLTRRVAHLLHQGVRPWNILAVTFTNKAAREMAERVHALVGPAGKDVRLGTFHSTCSFFLRHEIERLGYTRSFVIYDQDDQLRVAKDVIKELKVDPDKFTPKALLGVFDRAKNRLTLPHNLPGEEVTPVAQKALRAYERRLREANAVDFNDIINLSLRILREHPDVLRALARAAGVTCSSTSTKTRTSPSTTSSACSPGAAGTSPWSATTTSRSTPSAAPTSATSSTLRRTSPTLG
jgi:DNA helicase-2/ATP-dependent DNA helicase PcrA